MSHEIKSMLTMLNRSADLAAILGWANRLAKDFDATADGAFLQYELPTDAYLFFDGSAYHPVGMVEQIEKASAEAERAARDEFDCASRRGARCRMGALNVLSDGMRGGLARLSRHYDFALTHLPEGSSVHADELVLAELLLQGGVPVFAAPRTAACDMPLQTALVAWDASLEASRALRAALPFLKECRRVLLRTIGDTETRGVNLNAASRYLQLHGVEIDGGVLSIEESAGKTILSEADRLAADFIVMGAFSHKPWREQLFGGATHDVVRASRKPVLLAH
jgi:nucleotide-binding universal stress UspA family protein